MVERFDVGYEVMGIAVDETVSRRHVEKETVADNLRGLVVGVGAIKAYPCPLPKRRGVGTLAKTIPTREGGETGIRFRAN